MPNPSAPAAAHEAATTAGHHNHHIHLGSESGGGSVGPDEQAGQTSHGRYGNVVQQASPHIEINFHGVPPGVAVTGLPSGVTAPTPPPAPAPPQAPAPPTPPTPPTRPNQGPRHARPDDDPPTVQFPPVPTPPAPRAVGRGSVYAPHGRRAGLGAAGMARNAGEDLLEVARGSGRLLLDPATLRAAQAYGLAQHRTARANSRKQVADRDPRLNQTEQDLINIVAADARHNGLSPGMTALMATAAYVESGEARISQAQDAGRRHGRWFRTIAGLASIGAVIGLGAVTGGVGLLAAPAVTAWLARWNYTAERRLQNTPEAVRAEVERELGRVTTGISERLIRLDPRNEGRMALGHWDTIGNDLYGSVTVDRAWRGGAAGPGGPTEAMGLSAGARAQAELNRRQRNRHILWGSVAVGTSAALAGAGFFLAKGMMPWQHTGSEASAQMIDPSNGGNTQVPPANFQPTVDLNQHAWNVARDLVGPQQANDLMHRAVELANANGGNYSYDPNVSNGMLLFDGKEMVGNQRFNFNNILSYLAGSK